MRRISKKSSPDFFNIWKINFKQTNGVDPDYSKFIGEEKQKLREALYEEQFGLCCYCCKSLMFPYPYSEESHIEHFRPKGNLLYATLSLEYSNLHLSCSGFKSTKDSCGHKKDDWFDEALTVSPLEENVEAIFEYTIDGSIKAANGNIRASKTIEKLELDSFALKRLRSSAIYVSGIFDDDFDDEKRKLITEEYSRTENGCLKAFCNAVLYCAANVV